MSTYTLDPIKVKDHACAFSVKGLSYVVKTWWSQKINRIAPTPLPELWQSVLNFLFCVFENINSQWSTHEKLFLCSCCDKAFECSHNLNCHMAIHKERNHSMAVILTRTQIRLSMASSILPELMEHDGHQSTSWHIHVKFR